MIEARMRLAATLLRGAAFLKDEAGQDLVEYSLIAVILALGSISSMNTLAMIISGVFDNVSGVLNGAL